MRVLAPILGVVCSPWIGGRVVESGLYLQATDFGLRFFQEADYGFAFIS
jgi:hypothetical protein